ncbi:hypothetical protein PSTG_00499 [Puccinia striiformis f. sp. tritici PST-78]|uniref:Uncharacterized protein n=1 Tax=Puccinia striiformis f. sp. tritici PST-78 TaxID=1165861 RepID=A0A0L0W5T5_9BASI|nr:hypothetical protein PSTG_00499 [Puccinia striiformis f. sp. tritici PST-78]
MPPSENNNSDSVGKSTRSSHPKLVGPGEFKRGSSKKELPSDHRVSVPNPPGVQDPVHDGDSHRQPSGGSDVPGTSHQEPPLFGAAHTNQCIDFVNRGMESYYRSLTETGGRTSKPTEPSAAVPTTDQNTTPDSGGQPTDPEHSSPASSHL